MPGGQVSVWVPVIVGIIGLSGTLGGAFGGQWLSARMTRFRERDHYWQQERVKSYSEFLAAMNDWSALVREMCQAHMTGQTPSEQLEDAADEARSLASQSWARAELIASGIGREVCREGFVVCYDAWAKVSRKRQQSEPVLDEEKAKEVSVEAGQVHDFICGALRADLGLPEWMIE